MKRDEANVGIRATRPVLMLGVPILLLEEGPSPQIFGQGVSTCSPSSPQPCRAGAEHPQMITPIPAGAHTQRESWLQDQADLQAAGISSCLGEGGWRSPQDRQEREPDFFFLQEQISGSCQILDNTTWGKFLPSQPVGQLGRGLLPAAASLLDPRCPCCPEDARSLHPAPSSSRGPPASIAMATPLHRRLLLAPNLLQTDGGAATLTPSPDFWGTQAPLSRPMGHGRLALTPSFLPDVAPAGSSSPKQTRRDGGWRWQVQFLSGFFLVGLRGVCMAPLE